MRIRVRVWRYRDLLLLLVHRDFVAMYKQTVLGPAWFILQPLLTTLVFTLVVVDQDIHYVNCLVVP